MTRDRTRALIKTLLPDFPALKTELFQLLSAASASPAASPAASSADPVQMDSYRKFLDRWGYNEEMRRAIAEQVRAVIEK